MGALCSGKSENPASIDPPKTILKNREAVSAVPKSTYSPSQGSMNNGGPPNDVTQHDHKHSNAKLQIDENDVKKI